MTLTHRQLVRPLALALVTGAVAAPAASARVNSDAAPSQPTSATQVVSSPPEVVRSSGFDWADAGVGAGAVLAVVLAGLGARLTVGHRSHPQATAARPTA